MPVDDLKKAIGYILDGREYPSAKDKMVSVSEYYIYMSESIIPERIIIGSDRELLISFEAIYLWVQEQATYLPVNLKEQIDKIYNENNLCELFAILASLSEQEIYSINKKRRLNNSVGLLASLVSSRSLSQEENQLVSESSLINAKIGLTRLCQVAKFASSKLDNEFYSNDNFEKFSKRYDPNTINKSKIISLLNLFKSQIEDIEDNEDVILLKEKINEVEKEINKRRPHWGLIFSTIFVIFGFTADLKTLNPEVYTKPLQIIESILYNFHEDGQVEKSTNYHIPKKENHSQNQNFDRQLLFFKKEDIDSLSEEEN